MSKDRTAAIELIRSNIQAFGHHIYVICGKTAPRFAYTIGLLPQLQHEIVVAGAEFYTAGQIRDIINETATILRSAQNLPKMVTVLAGHRFLLGPVDRSWTKLLLLGAFDYYARADVPAVQIAPVDGTWTIDVPDMSKSYSTSEEPVWRWLTRNWAFSAPPNSVGITNMEALRGLAITEASRWEDDQWELFFGEGTNVAKADMRVVPLSTLIGFDDSLLPVLELEVGQGLRRAGRDDEWDRL